MSFTKKLLQSWFGKAALASAALGGFLLMGGATPASAHEVTRIDHRVDHRIAYDQMRYHRAVERYGRFSPEARHWAHQRRMAVARREHLRREFAR